MTPPPSTEDTSRSAIASRAGMSIEECRRYLEGIDLSEEEAAQVRDAIFTLARKVFDETLPW